MTKKVSRLKNRKNNVPNHLRSVAASPAIVASPEKIIVVHDGLEIYSLSTSIEVNFRNDHGVPRCILNLCSDGFVLSEMLSCSRILSGSLAWEIKSCCLAHFIFPQSLQEM